MGMTAFDSDSSPNGLLSTGRETPSNHERSAEDMAQTEADLRQRKSLSSRFGDQGEWEVRTTLITNRQTWRYHSGVFLRGKERRKDFPPIDVDRTHEVRQIGAVSEELLAAFAREAAEVHIARCDGVKEYLTLAPFFPQPVPRHRRTKRVALVLLSVVALLSAYWGWKGFNISGSAQPDRQVISHRVQWQPLQISHQYPAGESFEFSLPRLERSPQDVPVEITLEISDDRPNWLQLDRERLRIRGTAPLAAANQTYQLSIRAHTARGGDSRLSISLTITGPEDRGAPVRQLPGHWTW